MEKNYLGNFMFFLIKYFQRNLIITSYSCTASNANENCSPISVKAFVNDSVLIILHQSVNQKRIIEKYGNEICLLDATYKTTKYLIPLFFLAVKTNVVYQIAGLFAVQDETTDASSEAVAILKY